MDFMDLQEALAAVSAAGMPFETHEVVRDGVSYREFVHAPTSLRAIFEAARTDQSIFLVYEDEEWSFARVMEEADALGYALVHHFGIRKGDRVGITMRNLPEWIVSYAAILSVGAISVSLNAWWTEDELDYALNDAGLLC
jgi:long-chain acyl-CoA synthetase